MKIPKIRIYPSRKSSKQSALVARAYFNGETFTDTLNISVPPSAWNESRMSLNNRLAHADALNEEIYRYKLNLEAIIIDLQKKNRLSVFNVKRLLKKGYVVHEKPKSYDHEDFIELFNNEFIQSKRKVSENTKTAYRSVLKPLKLYAQLYYPNNNDGKLSIHDMNNVEFYDEFLEFMIEEMKYAISTQDKHIKHVKMVLKYAYKKAYLTTKEFEDFERLDTSSEPLYLDMGELKQISNTPMPNEKLDNVKDWLIISCFTGLRISDFMNLSNDAIDFKNQIISTSNVKTGEFVKIPIQKNVENIFRKRNWKLPRKISDQRYNEYVKEVCEIAKINSKVFALRIDGKKYYTKHELVSSHIGRRSFATNCYLNGWLEPAKLCKITGHKSIEMLMKYIKIDKVKVAQQLGAKWNEEKYIF